MGMHNPTKFRIDSSIFRDFTVGGCFVPPPVGLNIHTMISLLFIISFLIFNHEYEPSCSNSFFVEASNDHRTQNNYRNISISSVFPLSSVRFIILLKSKVEWRKVSEKVRSFSTSCHRMVTFSREDERFVNFGFD